MKQRILRSALLATAFVASGSAAFAKDITASSAATSITGSTSTFTWSPEVIGLFGAISTTVSPISPATYVSPTVTSTTNTFSYDEGSNAITALTLGGGFSLSMSAGFVGGPGQVSFTDVKLDVAGKKIFANVTGANGLAAGTYDIFNVATVGGATSFSGAGGYATSASGLTLTTTGADVLMKGLGLVSFARGTLTSTANYGTLSFNSTLTTSAVPEPASYALMLMGMCTIAGLRLSRRKG